MDKTLKSFNKSKLLEFGGWRTEHLLRKATWGQYSCSAASTRKIPWVPSSPTIPLLVFAHHKINIFKCNTKTWARGCMGGDSSPGQEPVGRAASPGCLSPGWLAHGLPDPEGQWLSSINICESFLLFPIDGDSPQTTWFQTHSKSYCSVASPLSGQADPIIC